ncbi:MAG: GGDEF domain-containing protein [Butyrivibrio sp.]|nr:GGDEF domain-containing protein [Butyrivibrio sp.]
MKPEFYDKSKRVHIYNTIYIIKIICLCILVAFTIAFTVLFNKYKALFHEVSGETLPPIFLLMEACLVFFIIAILLDFIILRKTASIGRHLSKMAYIDKLTGLPNRYSCDLLIESFNDSSRLPNAGFVLLKINNLMAINKSSGHDNGNFLISEFCSILEDVSQDYGYAGRNGGNEFLLLMDNCDSTKADMFLMELTKRIHGYNGMNVGDPMEVAYSRALNVDEQKSKISHLVSLGYKRLRETPQILS